MKNKSAIIFAILLIGVVSAIARAQDSKAVVKIDPGLDEIVSSDAQVQLVKSGFGFTEGINWVKQGKTGFLIFSDLPANAIDKMTSDGRVSVYVDHTGYAGPIDGYNMLTIGSESTNGKDPKDPLFRQFIALGNDGLTLDPQGRMVVAGWAGRDVYRIEKNGSRTMLAERYEGKRLGGPNDVVVKRDGSIYFSDTFGGLRLRDKDPSKELDFQAIFMFKDGKLSVAIKDIATPNGLAFSPDEKYLYANGSGENYIRRYDVQPDDTLTHSELLIKLNEDRTLGITDGMRVDSKGNIYSAGPRGVWIISPAGKHLGTILVPERVANFTFGDPDYKTLYIAARTSIYKVRVNISGNHF